MTFEKRSRLRVRDPEARSGALIQAAVEVFAAKGYDAATTRQIAAQAGVAEGLIHRYFGGKAGLLAAILKGAGEADVDESLRAVPPAMTLEAELEALLLHQFENIWEGREFIRVAFARAAIEGEVARLIRDAIHDRHRRIFEERLKARAGVSADAAATLALAVVDLGFAIGFFRQVLFEQDREWLRGQARALATSLAISAR